MLVSWARASLTEPWSRQQFHRNGTIPGRCFFFHSLSNKKNKNKTNNNDFVVVKTVAIFFSRFFSPSLIHGTVHI